MKTRSLAVILLLALLLASCQNATGPERPQDRLIGTWAGAFLSTLTYTFKADGTVTMTSNGVPLTQKYTATDLVITWENGTKTGYQISADGSELVLGGLVALTRQP